MDKKITFNGVTFRESELKFVTIERNGVDIDIRKPTSTVQPIGFSKPADKKT